MPVGEVSVASPHGQGSEISEDLSAVPSWISFKLGLHKHQARSIRAVDNQRVLLQIVSVLCSFTDMACG